MKTVLLKARYLSQSFNGRPVFTDFKFSLLSGESVLLQGENGSGKTTILKILSGLLQPTSGQFMLNGQPGSEYSQVRHQLRSQSIYLHQQPFLFNTSVKNNLLYAKNSASLLAQNEQQHLFAQLAIEDLLNHNAANLSIGQKQRVALARSLFFNPPVLLLDEPFTAMDKESYRMAVKSLSEYRQRGGTLLMVSHQHDRSFELLDTCWCIHPKGVLYCVSAG